MGAEAHADDVQRWECHLHMLNFSSVPGTEINDMITNKGMGNEELVNLPRKINIGLSPSRDDFPHTHINDVGLKAVHDPETGKVSS